MLFYDDLYSDPQALVERLEHIRLNPNVGAERQPFFRHNGELLRKLAVALRSESRPRPSLSDLDRLKIIETTVRNEERKAIAPFCGSRFLYTGAPGTGKTFRLLKVALAPTEPVITWRGSVSGIPTDGFATVRRRGTRNSEVSVNGHS
jgi:hypothetical protein